MSTLATRRLIDATSTLAPAERALLNLWVNRGLDDRALATMTGMTEAMLATRRQAIVTHLSVELGLPPEEIRGALGGIAESSTATQVRNAEPAPKPAPVPEATAAPEPSAPPAIAAALRAEPVAEPEAQPPRHRTRWAAVAPLVAVLIVGVIVAVSSGGSSRARTAPTRTAARARASTPAPAAPPSPSTSPAVSAPPIETLGSLPGGLADARGTVMLVGPMRHLKLRLSVTGLPVARNGHYEVWLYNSVLDSAPLGLLRGGVTHLTAGLPRDGRHYRWIDISFQPVGQVNHSGESVLRAANPAAQSRAQLKRRSARRRQLHSALAAARPAPSSSRTPVRHSRRVQPSGRRRPRHPRSGHPRRSHRRRSSRGSSRAKRSK